MRLALAISEAQTVNAPELLRWLRTAAAYWVEAAEEGTLYVAVFNDFPKSVEAIARLLSEVDNLCTVRIALDGKPVTDQVSFFRSLVCYYRSLYTSDDCRRCATITVPDGACPDPACRPPCPLVCLTCLRLSGDQQPTMIPFDDLARRAEVEWCPNLRLRHVSMGREC